MPTPKKITHDKEYKWINNWLYQRRGILGKNAHSHNRNAFTYVRDMFRDYKNIGNDERKKQMNRLNDRYEFGYNGNYFNKPTEANRKDLIPDIKWEDTNPNDKKQISLQKLQDYNRYLGTLAQTQLNNKNIYYFTTNKLNPTIIHERTHALSKPTMFGFGKPQEEVIGDYIYNGNDYKNKDVENNTYLDNPKEIYSRLMEFRYDNNIKPDKVWDENDLNILRKQDNVKDYDLLKRYNNNFLLHLFNNVAENKQNNQNQTIYMAKYGGQSKSRRKCWIGAAIGAATSIGSGIMNMINANKQQEAQQRAINLQNSYEFANNMNNVLNSDSIDDQYRKKMILKYGGCRNKANYGCGIRRKRVR